MGDQAAQLEADSLPFALWLTLFNPHEILFIGDFQALDVLLKLIQFRSDLVAG
jgi:hypothetical protein